MMGGLNNCPADVVLLFSHPIHVVLLLFFIWDGQTVPYLSSHGLDGASDEVHYYFP